MSFTISEISVAASSRAGFASFVWVTAEFIAIADWLMMSMFCGVSMGTGGGFEGTAAMPFLWAFCQEAFRPFSWYSSCSKSQLLRAGPYVGPVDRYALIDLRAGTPVPSVPGAYLTLTAKNVLGNEHREFVGAPELGRFVRVRLTYAP